MYNEYKSVENDLMSALKKKYFYDSNNTISLEQGDYLVKQNETNKRLYLVLKGSVAGYLDRGEQRKQLVFHVDEDMIVGFHSFFSKTFLAYADVIAQEKTKLAYIEYDDVSKGGSCAYLEDFLPLLVNELSSRQLLTQELMQEKEAAMKKLYQSDKLATLGQLAAGLAHELNNAIGVIKGNSEWIAQRVSDYFKGTERKEIFSIFSKGFGKGQYLSSNEVRDKKRKIEKEFKLKTPLAKKIAKIDYDAKEVEQLLKQDNVDDLLDRMHQFWEMGVAIHDILLASSHGAHVLKSIKELSVTDQERHELELDYTIREALTLLKNVVRDVEVDYQPGKVASIIANSGELVQIWVNIIKNGCESMLTSKVKKPTVTITTGGNASFAWIRISDNGPGIPTDLLEKIFRPNFTTKKGGLSFGLGLGLSIVQRLVDSYNGRIEVDSVAGKTSFTIFIPTATSATEINNL